MGTGYFVTYFYTFKMYNLSKTKSRNSVIPITFYDFPHMVWGVRE